MQRATDARRLSNPAKPSASPGIAPGTALGNTIADLFLTGVSKVATTFQSEQQHDQDDLARQREELVLNAEARMKTIPDPPGWSAMVALGSAAATAPSGGQGYSNSAKGDDARRKWELQVQGLLQTKAISDFWKMEVASLTALVTCPTAQEDANWQPRFLDACRTLELDRARSSKFRAFAVVASQSVELRRSPTLDDDARLGRIMRSGQCFVSGRCASVAGTRWMRVDPAGWIFEAKDGQQVLAEVADPEIGPWWYRVVCRDFVGVRRAPCRSNEARTGYVMCPNEVCVVSFRCKINGERYLLLSDGRGWIFETAPANDVGVDWCALDALERYDHQLVVVEANPIPPRVACLEDNDMASRLRSMVAATSLKAGKWLYLTLDRPVLAFGTRLYGTGIPPGEQIHVNARISADGRKNTEVGERRGKLLSKRTWLRLADGRGWIPKVDEEGSPLVKFIRGQEGPWSPNQEAAVDREESEFASRREMANPCFGVA